MRIENKKAREFYLEESVKSKWSVRQLENQVGRFYYERLLASQDKKSVANEIGLPEKVEPKNIIREPYVLEFLGLEGNTIPEQLKNETGKKSDKFLNWLRAQRVLIYFNNEVSLGEAIRLNNIYINALTEKVIAIEGAYETLEYLSNMGYYIIIATNGPKVATRDKLLKINCIDFVNEILSADMFGYMKPNKEFF